MTNGGAFGPVYLGQTSSVGFVSAPTADAITALWIRPWSLASCGAGQAWGLCAKAYHAVTALSSPVRLGQ